MKNPVSLLIPEPLFATLSQHLFPGDDDEHGAVIMAGVAETARGTRLLAREVVLARDGVDYVPGQRGYRALTPAFVASQAYRCGQEKLCYLAVHCHRGDTSVAFSSDDRASHQRGYGALLGVTKGGPVGALVFARNAVAGDIWVGSARSALDHATIVGSAVRSVYPSPRPDCPYAPAIYGRHALLFGDAGQAILSALKVGIIGLGGGGSLLNEWLARLGVGHIVAVDFDRLEWTNLPRIAGATYRDAGTTLAGSDNRMLQGIARRLARHKVSVAKRVARRANPEIRFDAVIGDLLDEGTALTLADADFIFLATDNIRSRLVFNALIHQYLIPGAQIGVRVEVDKQTRQVVDVTARTRLVLPYAGGGCLWCAGQIPPARLQEEGLTEQERREQRYVDDPGVHAPSVITLNTLSAAQAANDLMMMFTGLYDTTVQPLALINRVQRRTLMAVELACNPVCPECGGSSASRYARGDLRRLPCRR